MIDNIINNILKGCCVAALFAAIIYCGIVIKPLHKVEPTFPSVSAERIHEITSSAFEEYKDLGSDLVYIATQYWDFK